MAVTHRKNNLDFSASKDWQQANVIDIYKEIIALVPNAGLMPVTSVENIVDLGGSRVSDLVEISSITNDAPQVFPLGETLGS